MGHIQSLSRRFPDLLAVTKDDLETELARIRFTHKAETRKSYKASFSLFYGWALAEHLITSDPSSELQSIHIPLTLPRMAPDDVVQLALLTATLEQRAMILLARFACLRLTELTTLHTRSRRHDELLILGKGEKERLVGVNDELMKVLLEREQELGGKGGFYFPGRWGSHMHPQSVNKIITRITGCNPHSLRHAGATAAYNATHDLRAIQLMLGHSSMATTQRYLSSGQQERKRVAEATAFGSPLSQANGWPSRLEAA